MKSAGRHSICLVINQNSGETERMFNTDLLSLVDSRYCIQPPRKFNMSATRPTLSLLRCSTSRLPRFSTRKRQTEKQKESWKQMETWLFSMRMLRRRLPQSPLRHPKQGPTNCANNTPLLGGPTQLHPLIPGDRYQSQCHSSIPPRKSLCLRPNLHYLRRLPKSPDAHEKAR